MRHPVASTLLVFLLLVCAPRKAEAQSGMAQAVYGDLRDVIEELIKTEITSNVVARVRERSPALGFYFSDTLGRLESSYWGNLNSKLIADLVVMVSDYVYWSVGPAAASGRNAKGRGAASFFSCFQDTSGADSACQQIQGIHDSKGRSLVDRHCRALDQARGPDADLACNLALATRSGLNKQSSMAIRHVVDAVTDILLHDVKNGPVKRRMRKMAQTWLGNIDRFPVSFPDLFLATEVDPQVVDAVWIKEQCNDRVKLAAYFTNPSASLSWICFAVSYAGLPNSLAFRVRIELPKGAGAIEQLHSYWRVAEFLEALEDNTEGDPRPYEQRLYSMFVNSTMMEYCARNMELPPARGLVSAPPQGPKAVPSKNTPAASVCTSKALEYGHPVGANITVKWLDLEFHAAATSTKFQAEVPVALARVVKSFRLGMARIAEMRELVPGDLRDAIFVEDRVQLEPTLEAFRAFLRIGRLVSELRARWYLWPSDPELSGAEKLKALDLGGLLTLAVEEAATRGSEPGSPSVRPHLSGRNGLALRRVLDLAFRADLREIAVESIRLALGLNEDPETYRPYETFFLSLSGYLLDDAGTDGVTVTRESFRAAAKDLLRTLPSDGVPTADERWRIRYLPALGARIAFNEHFRSESGRAGMRTLVSADWPGAYLAISDYAGLRVSILDLIAPLSELALREVGPWRESNLLLLDLVRPRAALWLAVPQFSRRLILEAGVGLRLVGVREDAVLGAGTYQRERSPEIHFGISYAL